MKGIYAITPLKPWKFSTVESMLDAGIHYLQYRSKDETFEERLKTAEKLKILCNRYAVPLIINDDPTIAQLSNADGLHLGQKDLPHFDPNQHHFKILGITCHNSLDLAKKATQQSATYLSFGAFYPSSTKPTATPASPAILQQAKNTYSLPIVAIGGITPHNAPLLLKAGADCLAVCDALFSADDISLATKSLLRMTSSV